MTKERPILFSTAMVQALLEGRKTQTRRIIKPQPQENGGIGFHPLKPYARPDGGFTWTLAATGHGVSEPIYCPYGRPGDRLWVRESFWQEGSYIRYKADGRHTSEYARWKPSIHMPRTACRLVLEITNVRVERLHDISAEDAMAEGVMYSNHYESFHVPGTHEPREGFSETAQSAFLNLWETINGKKSLEQNQFVWCVSFNVVKN